VFALLRRNAELRRLFTAHAVSRAGDAFNTVALVVVVFDLTASGFGVAAVVALEVLPVLLFGPVAGVLADRHPRRSVMIAADLARAGLAATIAAAHSRVGVVYAAAFAMSLGTVVFNPAASSVLPDVVDEDEVVTANSALWTVAVVAQIVLAPTAGVLIDVFGVGVAFALNAASFVVSAFVVWSISSGTPSCSDPWVLPAARR
jgi:MFS family permease